MRKTLGHFYEPPASAVSRTFKGSRSNLRVEVRLFGTVQVTPAKETVRHAILVLKARRNKVRPPILEMPV